jgi:hypothetical protein
VKDTVAQARYGTVGTVKLAGEGILETTVRFWRSVEMPIEYML